MLHLNPVLSKIIKIVLCNWNKAETNDILEENLNQKLEILSWQKIQLTLCLSNSVFKVYSTI